MISSPAAMRRLVKEINHLRTEPPEGIRISINEDNMLDVTGIIAGPAGTPYEGGYFRVSFNFTEEFPNSPPKCRMLTKIFHPNVSSAGEICVNTLKKDWKPTYGIEHILVTVKCLLIYPNPESALDEEAGRELLENYDGYSSRAKLITGIHATPKTPPPEFDIPSATSKSSPSTDAESSKTSPPVVTITPTTGEIENAPAANSIVPPTSTKPRSKGPTSNTPLVAVLSPAAPPPLQPATTNSISTKPVPTSTALTPHNKMERSDVPTSAIPNTKAIKRTATTAALGADKRKKALKRL